MQKLKAQVEMNQAEPNQSMGLQFTQLNPAQYSIQRWKNGLGETQVIAIDSADPFRWRVSWATIEHTSEFSCYPGYQRCLVVVEGGAMELVGSKGQRRRLLPFSPFFFSGSEVLTAKVATPVRDFNVICREEFPTPSVYVSRIMPGEDYQFPLNGNEHLLFVLNDGVVVTDRNTEQTFDLKGHETLRISRGPTSADKAEYLALRLKGKKVPVQLVWVVIHF